MGLKAKKQGAILLALTAALLLPRTAFGWGDSGHRIVARLGQDGLSPQAQRRMVEIAGSRSLAMLATWPDFIRSEKPWGFAAPWHYVTVEDADTLETVLERSALTIEPDNVVEAISYFAAILDGDARRRESFEKLMVDNRARPIGGSTELAALAFLVHFVGDIHQPLHVGRGGDHGGNSIAVNWFGEVQKLHTVWDSGLIDHQQLSFTEFVEFLEAELAGTVEPGDGGPAAWAQESIDYRHRLYEIWSRTSRDNYLPELGYRYVYDHIGTVKRRLYLGGLRLAALLESIFD